MNDDRKQGCALPVQVNPELICAPSQEMSPGWDARMQKTQSQPSGAEYLELTGDCGTVTGGMQRAQGPADNLVGL